MPASDSRPSWRRVPLLPWLGLVRPGFATGLMSLASWPSFLAVHFFYLILWSAMIVVLVAWEETRSWHWRPPPVPTTVTTSPYSAAAFGTPANWHVQRRSMGEVWSAWHVRGPLGDAEAKFGVMLLVGVLGTCGLAWLHLPTVHAGGAVAASYGRAVRGLGCMWGPLLLGTGLLGSAIVWFNHLLLEVSAGGARPPLAWKAFIPASLPAGAAGFVYWLGRAMREVAALSVPVDLPPLCEGCGYNLTHVPLDGLCPECGREAALSLEAVRSRCAVHWDTGVGWRRLGEWCATNWQILVSPAQFYRRLHVRSDSHAAGRFAALHFVAMAFATAVSVVAIFSMEEAKVWSTGVSSLPQPTRLYPLFVAALALWAAALLIRFSIVAVLMLLFTAVVVLGLLPALVRLPTGPTTLQVSAVSIFVVPLFGWFIHRVIAGLVSTWWFVRGALADPRAARKVLAYETAFLWVPWFFGILFTSSMIVYDNWITQLFGRRFFAGLPIEALVLLGCDVAIILLWLYRYHVAGRAVRWANF